MSNNVNKFLNRNRPYNKDYSNQSLRVSSNNKTDFEYLDPKKHRNLNNEVINNGGKIELKINHLY